MMKLFAKWTHWLHEGYASIGEESVSAFRVFYAFFMLSFGPTTYVKVASYAPELYNPKRSLAIWFDLPNLAFFQFLDWLILILLVLLLFGVLSKWTSLLLGLALIVGNSFLYSFDKINHGNLLITFIPLIMAFSNWDAHFSLTKNQGVRRAVDFWPVSLMAFIIGFGMFTAGFIKLISGWLNPNYQAIKFHVFKSYLNLREGVLTEWVVNINSLVFWELLDYVIIIFELGFLIAAFSRRWFEGWVFMAILFHFGVLLVLDISFFKNVVAYSLFLDWFFVLYVLPGKRILDFLSKGFNYVGLAVVLLVLGYLKVYHGGPYLLNFIAVGKLVSSGAVLTTAILVMVGSFIYRISKRASLS